MKNRFQNIFKQVLGVCVEIGKQTEKLVSNLGNLGVKENEATKYVILRSFMKDGNIIVSFNPTEEELERSPLDLELGENDECRVMYSFHSKFDFLIYIDQKDDNTPLSKRHFHVNKTDLLNLLSEKHAKKILIEYGI